MCLSEARLKCRMPWGCLSGQASSSQGCWRKGLLHAAWCMLPAWHWLQACTTTMRAAYASLQAREIAGALDAAGAPGDAPPSTLWDFEPAFNLLEAVQKLVADQRDVVVRLQGAAKALLAALSSVPV